MFALSMTAAVTAGLPSNEYHTVMTAPTMPGGRLSPWVASRAPSGANFSKVVVQLSLQPASRGAARRIAEAALTASTPGTAEYGRYLGRDAVDAMLAPAAGAAAAVAKWAAAAGVSVTQTRRGAVLTAVGSPASFETMFDTTVGWLTNPVTGQVVVRADDLAAPAAIAPHIAAIHGLHGLPLPRRRSVPAAPAVAASDPTKVTPSLISTYYGIAGRDKAVGGSRNRQAVAEFQGQTIASGDIQTFFSQYVTNDTNASHAKISKFVGDMGEGTSGVEAALDVEYIMGVAPGVATEFWGWKGHNFCADVKQFTTAVLSGSEEETPHVFSISYGFQGDMSGLGCTASLLADIDTDLAAIAARGISVIVSSGDSGSAQSNGPAPPGPPPPPPPQCQGTGKTGVKYDQSAGGQFLGRPVDGDGCCALAVQYGLRYWTFTSGGLFHHAECTGFENASGTAPDRKCESGMLPPTPSPGPGPVPPPPPVPGLKLWPSWPASSPWVTAVGATRFINQDPAAGEMAADQFGSGGGFSSMFDRANASWQDPAVSFYLLHDRQLPPANAYSRSGRATPDVSTVGEGFQVIAGGTPQSVAGTSASAPTFAAMVSLLNEARFAAGKPAMGLLNPFLYQNTDAFRDVVNGTNSISRDGSSFQYGWPCLPGWDGATGIGTPLFQKLLAAASAASAATTYREPAAANA